MKTISKLNIQAHKTDNSFLDIKVKCRIDHMPESSFKILDCFGGQGVVWNECQRLSGRSNIYRMGIDKQHRPGCVKGDNRKYLKSLDLSMFDVIDLDAYGVPFDQLEIIFKRKYHGLVFFTFIQSVLGRLPKKLILSQGISLEMYNRSRIIFSSLGWEFFKNWLAQNGVKALHYYHIGRKYYGCFEL